MDNYDGTMKEPTLLPTRFPNVLVSANLGIAVGMASALPGFNLNEVCTTAIAYLKNPECDLRETLLAPDFPTGGEIVLDPRQMEQIYRTGPGLCVRIRAKWQHLKKENIIEITEIPYTTTIEAIMDKVADLIKQGKIREISDMRDEIRPERPEDRHRPEAGRGPGQADAQAHEDDPADGFLWLQLQRAHRRHAPGAWASGRSWRSGPPGGWSCIRRRVYYDLQRKQEKLHLLEGLKKILLDIDRAIRIIRETEEDAEVVPNLMIGFGIDEQQAEFVAEIKLRNINKEHILKRTQETDALAKEIEELKDLVESRNKIKNVIVGELREINKKYKTPRRSAIVYDHEVAEPDEEDDIADYPVHVFLTSEGYFKKITPQSLRMSGEQKLKEGDSICQSAESTNKSEVIFLTDKAQAYKCRLHEFDDGKASLLGDYLPQKLQMSEGEHVRFLVLPGNYQGYLLYVYENGKAAKIPVKSFDTKSNRRRLTGAYCDRSPLVAAIHLEEEGEVAIYSTDGRMLLLNTAMVAPKATRSSQGVAVMALKKNKVVKQVLPKAQAGIVNESRYRTRTLPAAGALLRAEDAQEKQLTLEDTESR